MKDELTTILDAMRAAQAELADYLVSADRNAELTIAKLVGILDRREVVRAMRLLRALERPGRAPQSTLAEASWRGSPTSGFRNTAWRTPPRGHSGGVRHPVAEGGALRRCHAEKRATQKLRRLRALRLKARENLVKARWRPGTSGALSRCGRAAQGA